MSDTITSVLGYGACTNHFGWNPDAGKELYKTFADKSPLLREAFQNWKENNAAEDGELFDDELAFKSYADEYENDTYCTRGVEALIVDTLNDVFGKGNDIFHYEDCTIYVEATLPKDDAARADIPTTDWIRDILEKYVESLSKEAFTIGWHTIRLA